MRKIFIDLGAHNGQSIKRFHVAVKDAEEYEIYSFEPVKPIYDDLCEYVKNSKLTNVALINKAAWTSDGKGLFYESCTLLADGGTLLKGKHTGSLDYNCPVEVDTIDFSAWLRQFSKDDFIVLKLNIEGGEYPLLKHMMDTGAMELISELYVQFHSTKFIGKDRHNFKKAEAEFVGNILGTDVKFVELIEDVNYFSKVGR